MCFVGGIVENRLLKSLKDMKVNIRNLYLIYITLHDYMFLKRGRP